jgi:hypothetical protein
MAFARPVNPTPPRRGWRWLDQDLLTKTHLFTISLGIDKLTSEAAQFSPASAGFIRNAFGTADKTL